MAGRFSSFGRERTRKEIFTYKEVAISLSVSARPVSRIKITQQNHGAITICRSFVPVEELIILGRARMSMIMGR